MSQEMVPDDIGRAQEELGRAIGRARIGEDRELANRVRELGERLAHLLLGLLRMTRMHSPDNHAFDRPVEELHVTLVHLNEILGAVHLVAVEDQIYVNDIRIRTGEKATGIQELGGELQRHNVGGLTFHQPLEDPAIRALIGCLGNEPAPAEPRTALARALEAASVDGVELQGRFRFRLAGEERQEVTDRRDVLTRALAATDEAFQNLAAGRVPNPLPLRRIVTELLERDLGDPELWGDLPEGPPFARHHVRVARLALLVGREAGLSQSVMQDLGVSALYHDCGWATGAGAPSLSPEGHPTAGAWLLLRQKGFHEAKTRRLLATLEHHRDANVRPHPGLFGRILRIVEDYDTLSSRGGPHSPTMVLARMLGAAGTRYDAVLLQLLINALGAYPPGTLLRLEDGSVVRVAAPTRGADAFAHPLARRLRLRDGSPAPPDEPLIDLKDAGKLTLLQPRA
ncbi:MAG: hypothetical protein LJF30_03265 [Acidobacteria bacterium]|nr:hypothetical protein [Acidobacteriota bacterium]